MMKLLQIPKLKLIRIVALIVTVAALVGHGYKLVGMILTACALGGYLVLILRERIAYARRFKRMDTYRRWLVVSAALLSILFIKLLIAQSIPYFLLLLGMGIEYLEYDNIEKNEASR